MLQLLDVVMCQKYYYCILKYCNKNVAFSNTALLKQAENSKYSKNYVGALSDWLVSFNETF